MAIVGGRIQIGALDPLEVVVNFQLASGTGPKTSLTGITLEVVNPDNTSQAATGSTIAEIILPSPRGDYRIKIPAAAFAQVGVHRLRVLSNDATVDDPDPLSFERLTAPTVSAPVGGNLCTLADVQAVLGSTTTVQDALISTVITRISAFIEKYCARKFAAQAFTETANGEGGFRHWVANPPVISLTSVTINGSAQTLTNIVVDPATGELYHKAGLFLSWPPRAVTVVYQGGYAVLPQDIVQVATEMSAHRFKLYDRKNIGVRSEGVGPGDRQYITDDFMPQHVEVLDRHRLFWGTAGAVSYG